MHPNARNRCFCVWATGLTPMPCVCYACCASITSSSSSRRYHNQPRPPRLSRSSITPHSVLHLSTTHQSGHCPLSLSLTSCPSFLRYPFNRLNQHRQLPHSYPGRQAPARSQRGLHGPSSRSQIIQPSLAEVTNPSTNSSSTSIP